jgi:hypothetical protein
MLTLIALFYAPKLIAGGIIVYNLVYLPSQFLLKLTIRRGS